VLISPLQLIKRQIFYWKLGLGHGE
jgi:hypothetical protein